MNDRIHRRRLSVTQAVALPAFLLDVLIVISCFDDEFRRWSAIIVCGVLGALNVAVLPSLTNPQKQMKMSRIREVVNVVGQVLKIVVAHASVPTWGFLLAFATMTDRGGSVFSRTGVLVLLAAQIGFSVYFQMDWFTILAFSAATVTAMTVSVARSGVLIEAAAEQRRQRQRLEQLQEVATHQEKMSSLGMLAAGIAHEINNPMAFVTSNIHQLEKDLPHLCDSKELHSEYVSEIVPEIKEGIGRVNTIVDDLRRFARGDVESLSIFDVNDVIRSAVRMTQGRVGPGVTVSLALEEIPMQAGYPRQLSQIVVNLLVNATQAVARGGAISISSGCSDLSYWFSIKDNGRGMDKDTQSRIFEPFFTTKPIGEGTGLGLAVVHGMVEQLKGRIKVSSAPGKGARFTVILPRRNEGEDTGVFNARLDQSYHKVWM
ncbi:MAG: hypothetical protein JXR76_29895 [Deltaproteobacteria bacterium]|nr:hypothetical protein [Deltaproteobacteria bacterium]